MTAIVLVSVWAAIATVFGIAAFAMWRQTERQLDESIDSEIAEMGKRNKAGAQVVAAKKETVAALQRAKGFADEARDALIKLRTVSEALRVTSAHLDEVLTQRDHLHAALEQTGRSDSLHRRLFAAANNRIAELTGRAKELARAADRPIDVN